MSHKFTGQKTIIQNKNSQYLISIITQIIN